MNKAILISIKPEYVEKILNGEKTVEIRKSIPKCDLPCKVYIYCSKGQELWGDGTGNTWHGIAEDEDLYTVFELTPTLARLNGKVVAEFILKETEKFTPYWDEYDYWLDDDNLKETCLTRKQIWNYGKGKNIYGWHIDNLIIYEYPKQLSKFEKYGSYEIVSNCYKKQNGLCNKGYGMKGNYIGCEKARIKRPPQSYMYVEELKE